MSAIANEDAPTNEDFNADDAFAKLDDAAKPSKSADTEEDEEADDTADEAKDDQQDDAEASDEASDDEDSPEGDGDGEAAEGEDDDDSTSVKISDETVIKHKVDGEEREFTVGQLKRLAGQEASLTRKSQEVATKAKQLDTVATAHSAALESLLKKANEQWEPFSKINFLAAAKDPNISAEELEAAQNAAQAAWDNKQFLEQELRGSVDRVQKQRNEALQEAAKKCIETLADPEKGIKGWDKKTYESIRGFAEKEGIAKEVMDELVDPAAYKIIHMAMLYAKGKAAVKNVEKEGKDKKGKTPPKKIVKNSSSPKG